MLKASYTFFSVVEKGDIQACVPLARFTVSFSSLYFFGDSLSRIDGKVAFLAPNYSKFIGFDRLLKINVIPPFVARNVDYVKFFTDVKSQSCQCVGVSIVAKGYGRPTEVSMFSDQSRYVYNEFVS